MITNSLQSSVMQSQDATEALRKVESERGLGAGRLEWLWSLVVLVLGLHFVIVSCM